MKQNMILPLFKILASHFFSFGTFFEGFKKGVKGILKNILVIVLILYFIVVAGGMYIAVMNSVGNGLVNSGDIEKVFNALMERINRGNVVGGIRYAY